MTTVQARWVLGGGIGSGKSQVRRFLEERGVPTIDADSVGRDVIQRTGAGFAEVASRWPEVIVDGEIDRALLAGVVFSSPGELAALEAITHPYIFHTIRRRVEQMSSGVVVEMPLLGHRFGPDWGQLVVDCRDEVRLQRAMARGMSEPDVRSRMSSQPSRAVWLAAADGVIPNHGSIDDLREAVEMLLPRL